MTDKSYKIVSYAVLKFQVPLLLGPVVGHKVSATNKKLANRIAMPLYPYLPVSLFHQRTTSQTSPTDKIKDYPHIVLYIAVTIQN